MSGRIISFTDDNGRVHQGLLLPKKFKQKDFRETTSNQQFVFRDIGVLRKFLVNNRSMIADAHGIADKEREVVLEPKDGGWRITIQSSGKKKVARSVKFDKPLREAMGGDFYGRGKYMSAEFSDRRLPEVLKRLSDLTTLVGPASMRDAWVQSGGASVPDAVKSFDDRSVRDAGLYARSGQTSIISDSEVAERVDGIRSRFVKLLGQGHGEAPGAQRAAEDCGAG